MSYVFRCFTEKKSGFDVEAGSLYSDLKKTLSIGGLSSVRVFNRYDCEGIDEKSYGLLKQIVFSEPMCDECRDERLPDEILKGSRILAVEPLPGQFDQRSDSCSQCIQLLCGGNRPLVRAAKIYLFSGEITDEDFERIKLYLINPVEAREASLIKPQTLKGEYPAPPPVETLFGFTELSEDGLLSMLKDLGLAMDFPDIKFLRSYFKDEEKRDPTITELRMIDTYWSDHCRHTTFTTELNNAQIEDEQVLKAYNEYRRARAEIYGDREKSRPVTLMDMATCAPKLLKKRGGLKNLDESEEINACSIKIKARFDGGDEDWLLMFKNETHNHPTEIEPFGGAATCLGGAIRDPLSGRVYVHQAMRVTGAADPKTPESQTLRGKLSQRKLCQTASAGYSSYGNQIGLATGLVHEFYHPGYVAKRMEIGAVIGAAPEKNVVRKRPEPGDVVILLGGRTGRDGCGGATGSSKSHSEESILNCGSEVQKGNPPEERKIQRLFRNPEATALIKRCN
ncbi:MAG: phosphoribosylformylglycinamidine synthase, partial [Bacillota bacterium]|nr:phosphoribosylformylglycinamidine synthase [Bacillota bacterium]